MRRFALFVTLVVTLVPVASADAAILRARKATVDFGERAVGGEYDKRTRITLRGRRPLRLLVSAGLPDDFQFGLLPGSTCPVLDGGTVVAPRTSCYAVVRFRPTEFFVGWHATGQLTVQAFDPLTGALVAAIEVPVSGVAVL